MKWVCPVCGYVHEGPEPPEKCPVCKVPGSKFIKQDGEMSWAAEHVIGIAKDVPEEIKAGMVEFYADLYGDYYAGKTIVYSERIAEYGYQMWERFRSETVQFRQIEGMLKDSMANNNHAEIPNPIHQVWER